MDSSHPPLASGEAIRLRIVVSEGQIHAHHPLYEAIVLKSRELGLAGATVMKGAMGYGRHAHLHTAKILQLSGELPIIIEIVDRAERVEAFLPVLKAMMMSGGLATVEPVRVV